MNIKRLKKLAGIPLTEAEEFDMDSEDDLEQEAPEMTDDEADVDVDVDAESDLEGGDLEAGDDVEDVEDEVGEGDVVSKLRAVQTAIEDAIEALSAQQGVSHEEAVQDVSEGIRKILRKI